MKTLQLLALLLAFAAPAAATFAANRTEDDHRDERIVTVTGQHTVRIPATRARLTTMIETEAESPAAAQQTVREQSQSVLQFLQNSRVDRLQAGAMALHPIYGEHLPQPTSGGSQGPQVVRYRAQWTASFEIDAARSGEIADGIVEAGIARISSFDFTATEQELAAAQQDAARGAARRAREDAHALLDALGYEPGDVVRVALNPGSSVQPFNRRADMMMAFSAEASLPPTAVQPGLIEINASVAVEVAY